MVELLDPDEWPIGAHSIATLCRVSVRTAQRWLSGDSEAPYTAKRLIQLTQRRRIMPESWPNHFRFCSDDSLDVGLKIRTNIWMLEHMLYSNYLWSEFIRATKDIEKRMDDLERKLTSADIVYLDNYRRVLRVARERQYLLASGYESPIDKNVIPFRGFPL